MRTILFKNYDRIRLLILELIGRAGVMRYGEIFMKLENLPTTRYKLEVYPQIVREALIDLTEEKRVRVWRVDPQHPQQFSLTEAGLHELREGTADADALMDAILAVRKLFPSQRPATPHL